MQLLTRIAVSADGAAGVTRSAAVSRRSGHALALALASASVMVVALALGVSQAHAASGFTLSGSFSGQGADPGLLNDPQRVALRGSTGELFVADRANDRVQVFDAATHAILGQFGDATTTDDPFGIAVNQTTGDVYVSSQVSNTITKWSDGGLGYTRDLAFTSPSLGTDPVNPVAGEVFNFAAPLAVDPTSGDLLVADPTAVGDPAVQRVQRYASSGAYISSFDGAAAPGGSFQGLRDIAIDATGDIYVVDAGDNGRVLRFDAAGTPDATTPVYDKTSGPALIAVDPVGGDIAVAVNVTDPCGQDRVVSYNGANVETETIVPPLDGGCTIPTGLAFDAAGGLFAATADLCGVGAPCGGTTAVRTFAKTGTSATVSAGLATGVGDTTATLSGTLNPEGAPSTYWFETSTDGSSYSPATVKGPLDGSAGVPVSQSLSGLPEGTQHWFRLVARRGDILIRSAPSTFTTVDVNAPDVAVVAATDLSESGATVNATVDSNGSQTKYHFEYSSDGGGSWVWLPGPDGNPGTQDEWSLGNVLDQPTNVSEGLGGLAPNASYLTRVVATNAAGSNQADGTLDTLTGPPVLSEAAATGASDSSVLLMGKVNPRNSATTYHFEYGTDTSYGTSTASVTLPAADVAKTVSVSVTGLSSSTVYHFKLVADNGTGGPQETADQTFTTLAPSPLATISAVSGVTQTSATVAGSVNTRGLAGTASFAVVQADGGYSKATATIALPPVDGPQAVNANLAGLPVGGSFTVRVSVNTAAGESTSDAVTFSTQPGAAPQPPTPPPPTGAAGDWFAGLPITAPVITVPDATPSNVVTIKAKVKGTTATLTIGVPGPGALRVSGKRLTTVTKQPPAKGSVTIGLKLTKAGRVALANSKSGTLTVKVSVRFTPTGGTPSTTMRTITFKRKANR